MLIRTDSAVGVISGSNDYIIDGSTKIKNYQKEDVDAACSVDGDKLVLTIRDRRNTQRRNTQQAVAVLRAPQHATRNAFFRKAPATHFSCRNTQRCGVAALRFSYLQFTFIIIFY